MNDMLVLPVLLTQASVVDPTLTTLSACILSSTFTISGMVTIDYLKNRKVNFLELINKNSLNALEMDSYLF